MEIFDFPYHTLDVKYPESSISVAYGQGYEFTSAPKAPDQVEYTLNFAAMFFFETVPGYEDPTKNNRVNMSALEAFYNKYKMYGKFIYPHPTRGNLVVRFSEPLSYKVTPNGRGRVEPFAIKFKLQP